MGDKLNNIYALGERTSDLTMSHITISRRTHKPADPTGKEANVIKTIFWKGTPIAALTPLELRQALADALSELDFSRKMQSSDEVFSLILSSFLTGVITVLMCLGLSQLLF